MIKLHAQFRTVALFISLTSLLITSPTYKCYAKTVQDINSGYEVWQVRTSNIYNFRVTMDELVFALREGGERGYFMDDEECEIGMRCIAAPIFDVDHRVIAAVSLSGPISRMTKMRCELEIVPKLCSCAKKITEKVCGTKDKKSE